MPELAYVGCVEVSAHDADTIYVAATRYKLADYKPYLFKTSDGGTHLEIHQGRPAGRRDHPRAARRSGRRGPALSSAPRPASISASTTGRAGRAWAAACPWCRSTTSSSRTATSWPATHGRSFWILDDVTALRGLARQEVGGRKTTRLFAPRTAIRTKLHWSAGANVRTGIAYGPAFGIDGSTVHGRTGRRNAAFASTSTSARTRPTARSSITGWPRTLRQPVAPHLPRCEWPQDRDLLERRQGRAAAAQAGRQGRAEPLRLGHEVSWPDQDRLRPGAAPAQAAGARSRESARSDRRSRRLRRRSRGRRQDAFGALHRGQGPAPVGDTRRLRRRSSPCTRNWSRRCPS